jgi:peptidyl-prolyl cis-trans isomerase SurA
VSESERKKEMTGFRRVRATAVVAVALFATAWLSPYPALAQSEIRVVVNEEPITSYDIQNRAKLLRAMSGGRATEEDAVEQLIDEHLMLQEAARRNVVVSDAEVEAEFRRRAANANFSPADFERAMRGAGIDPRTFKSFLRANIAWSEIVRGRVRRDLDISEEDIAQALRGRDGSAETVAMHEYMLQQIVFVGGAEPALRAQANAFRSAFQGCDQSLAQAAGQTGVVVRPTVRREEGELSQSLRDALETLDVGGITGPERTAEGIQLVAVCAKTEIRGQTQASEEVRDELVTEQGELMARRYLRDLRADAVIDYR